MVDETPLIVSPVEAALAGLLHDIGKLAQRAHPNEEVLRDAYGADLAGTETAILPLRDGRYTHRHALWSDFALRQAGQRGLRWPATVRGARIEAIAVRHHHPRHDDPSDWIIAEADRLASGLDWKAQDEQHEIRNLKLREVELHATLPGISIGRGDSPGGEWRHAAERLSPEALLPRAPAPAGQPGRFDVLWKDWLDGFAGFSQHGLSAGRFERALLGLSERLLWAVPSSTVDQPDISLHDHARAVAAIAGALAAWHTARGVNDVEAVKDRRTPKFRLVTLDLSGIQAALLRLDGWKGAARILRARSFLMGQTVEAALHMLLERLGLPASAVLLNAGGKAEVLAADLPEFDKLLAALREALDRWMVEHWQGDLALILAAGPPFAAAQFLRNGQGGEIADGYREERARLGAELDKAKLRPLAGWNGAPGLVGSGVIPAPFDADGACASCGVRAAIVTTPQDGQRRCRVCDAAHHLGQRLAASDGFALLAPHADEADAPAALPGGLRLAPWSARGPEALMSVGFTQHDQGSAVFRPAPHIPRITDPRNPRYAHADIEEQAEADDLMTFAHIGAEALEEVDGRLVGRDLIAVVKADVDRLGQVFAKGLGKDLSPARIAQLSRLMDAYFAERLPWLLKREFPATYTVYAGGDDLMLVAPWRFALPLALRLREDFGAFAGGNPNLTLSAGIAFVHPKHPLALAVDEAEAALERAKQAGRDRCGVFADRTLRWDALRATLDLAQALTEAVRAKTLPPTLLHAMRGFAPRRVRAEAGEARAADWNPKWRYREARFLDAEKDKDKRERARAIMLRVLPPPGQSMTADAEIALTIALWRNR